MNSNSSSSHKSIHLHLLYHYVFAIMIVLTLIGAAFYWETIKVIDQTDYEFLADELNNIQVVLTEHPNDLKLLKNAVVATPVRVHNSLYRYYIRVLDNNNQLLIETPGMKNLISLPATSDQHFILRHHKKYYWNTHKGTQFLMLQAPVKLEGSAGTGLVQILLDTSYQHMLTHDKRIFIFILFLGAILSLLIGILVTRRGLRSLNTLTETVRNITTSSLGHRVEPKNLPKELSGLGQAFNEMLDRIEGSFVRLKQMSADMSHELRTPIMNLTGQTELLLSYDYSESEFRAAQASNLEELQRMSSIIENILFLARAENPKTELKKEDIDVNSEVAKVCEYYQAVADEKRIHISFAGQATVKADAVMFRRLMSNIVSNALKYTNDNGTITIAISEDVCFVTISVEDTGIGIEQHHLPKLFDRFYRVDSSRSTVAKGSGLGLAIVKSIIDMHHGHIILTSKPNIGTKVNISLPK